MPSFLCLAYVSTSHTNAPHSPIVCPSNHFRNLLYSLSPHAFLITSNGTQSRKSVLSGFIFLVDFVFGIIFVYVFYPIYPLHRAFLSRVPRADDFSLNECVVGKWRKDDNLIADNPFRIGHIVRKQRFVHEFELISLMPFNISTAT